MNEGSPKLYQNEGFELSLRSINPAHKVEPPRVLY